MPLIYAEKRLSSVRMVLLRSAPFYAYCCHTAAMLPKASAVQKKTSSRKLGFRIRDLRDIVVTTGLAEERTAVMVDRPGHWVCPRASLSKKLLCRS
jgi:hypothetical protein